VSLAVNEPQQADQFEITFPEGCQVLDQKSGKDYLVQADGSMQEYDPAGTLRCRTATIGRASAGVSSERPRDGVLNRDCSPDGYGNGAVWVLALYRVLVGPAREPGGRHTLTVLVTMLAGYALVYLMTPLDLEEHFTLSVDRLCMQLWPSA